MSKRQKKATKIKDESRNKTKNKMPATTKLLSLVIGLLLLALIFYAYGQPDQFQHLNKADVFRSCASFMLTLVLSTTALSVSMAFQRGNKEIRERLKWILEIACVCLLFAFVTFIVSLVPEKTLKGYMYYILFFSFAMDLLYLIDLCIFVDQVRRYIAPDKS